MRLSLVALALALPALGGCQKSQPPAPRAISPEQKVPAPMRAPKSYAERSNDRLVLIKDRLQLLKDQAAPLSGATLHMASARIKSIEAQIRVADKEIGSLNRQAAAPGQRSVINHRLAQIENDIDATSRDIAAAQGRREDVQR